MTIIRHSRPYSFVRIIIFFFFLFFLFFRRQGFRMITFDRQAGPLQNFNRSHVMVIGRSVSFSDPARPPGGGVGPPKHPKIPRFKTPGRCFCGKKIQLLKTSTPPPRPTPTPSPQNTYLNPCAIISTPNNSCVRYGLQPPTHLINRHSAMSVYMVQPVYQSSHYK